jgi:heme a synthase
MLRRLPTLTPRRYEQVCLAALVLVFGIILTGAAVRLTGSGLGCPNWPKCGGGYVAPLELHAWIEYGNRLITFLVGFPCLAAFVLSYRRRPYRRDLRRVSMLLPLGVLAQAVLGGFTVMYELKPGFVMAHFLLSQAILLVAIALWWRSRHEPDVRPREDRRLVLAVRGLMPVGAIVLFAGTLTTAAGPHPGSRATGEIVPRFTGFGVDTLSTMYHWHGRSGTLLGILAVAVWFLARRLHAGSGVRRSLTALCVLLALQGVVGLVQYAQQLPAGLVWIHVALATASWGALCLAFVTAGRLGPSSEPAGAEPVAPPPRRVDEPVPA